uniref:Wall-associated receptor kinase 2-like n=1 Tax=Nelumbo nucifera TaxID=4432 RepID=A0A822Z375_NELNU|nr:TPA_asm: hypothetical protein HUJ06_013795 [Nelumbo nucifera]
MKYLENVGIQTPIILDWAIRNKTCKGAGGMEDNVCGNNTYCTNSTNGPGYLCHCLEGYQGNPYLPDGCQALDRSIAKTCEKGTMNYACGNNTDCSISSNSPGYICQCMKGYRGNPYLPDGCQGMARPGCRNKCGNVSIPYPFGLVGDDSTCYRDEFKLFCNTATDPPNLTIYGDGHYDHSILNISLQGQLTFSRMATTSCHMGENQDLQGTPSTIDLPKAYRFSNTRNKFTAIGCNTLGIMSDSDDKYFHIGCISFCPYATEVNGSSCDGIGCCQTAIPHDLGTFNLKLQTYSDDTSSSYTWNISRCSFAFLSDQEWFLSNAYKLWDLRNKVDTLVNSEFKTTMIVDWAIRNMTCDQVQRGKFDYACGKNTECANSINGPGYLCHCKKGFHGNPYLSDGCQGNYSKLYHSTLFFTAINIFSSFTFVLILFLLICISWLYFIIRKRKLMKLKEKFFEKNGGLFLQQQLSSIGGSKLLRIFSTEELKLATHNYNEEFIIGRGGQGTVYKGILSDHQVVAIKMSRMMNENQIEQFINEIVILIQINHRNVVKLLGCCLETEVPLLVYEYVSNGNLFQHIQRNHDIFLSWEDRLKIATETAGALAYLHSTVSIPIIRRDIKSTNILLDENFTTKVSDFGVSRLLPVDQSQITTLVQGTLGYLDPEYFHTSQLTEKSDVYRFGVVLVELLTGKKPLSFERSQEQRNLSTYFIASMKENRLFQLIESQLCTEENTKELLIVAELARRCLNVKGEKRPTMKEVALELQGLRLEKHPWIQQTEEESMNLLSKHSELHVPQGHYVGDTSEQSSLQKDMIFSMNFPR